MRKLSPGTEMTGRRDISRFPRPISVNNTFTRRIALPLSIGAVISIGIGTFASLYGNGQEEKNDPQHALSTMGGSDIFPPNTRPIRDDDHLIPGQWVYIKHQEKWIRAELISIRPDGNVKTRFETLGNSGDVLIPAKHLRLSN
jgi:hypothetical protein